MQLFLQRILTWLMLWFQPPPPRGMLSLSIGPVQPRFIVGKDIIMSTLTLVDNQKCDLGPLQPVDAAGNPAPVDGVPAWASSDDTVATVAASADGLSAVVTTTGKLGTCQVSASADADLGAGVTTITGTLDVSVVAGPAVSLNIPTGTPTDK